MRKFVALVVLCASSTGSFAVGFAHVPDASLIKWQLTPEGVVFLRNLNDYDASFLGCCYAWSIDTKTPTGKAMWATILMKMAAAKPISIGVDNKAVPGSVLYLGNH